MASEIVESSDDLVVITVDGGGATLLEANAGGSTGPIGATGSTGAQGASLVWRGNWSSATAYSNLDVIHFPTASGGDGKSYVAIQAGTNQNPGTATSYWQVIVERPSSAVVLGPYTTTQTLGFVNSTGVSITLSNETIRPAASSAIDSRQKNGVTTTLPVTLAQGDIYEVKLSSVSGRVYVGYRAD